MFWRILRRLLVTHRARLTLVLLALSAGAAITAALLNLEVDAERRVTKEFRAFGANIVIAPRDASVASTGTSLDEAILQKVSAENEGNPVTRVAFLYLVADAIPHESGKPVRAVVVGYAGRNADRILVSSPVEATVQSLTGAPACDLGQRVAALLHLHPLQSLDLRSGERAENCQVRMVKSFGGPEDDQVFLSLDSAQRLASLPRRISLVQLSVPGAPQSIERFITELQKKLPDADVHGIRQFTEAEAMLYTKIRGLLIGTVGLILLLTALCVMAAMTGVAMERQRDVGLMKALGGAASRVVRLFLTEAALLGLIGGLLGALAGIGISIWLGKAVFGVAAQPRLIVYPVAVALTVLVAVAGAFPLRRLAGVRPGEILRSVS